MYNLELDRVVEEIKKRGACKVLLQLPDGMRPFAVQMTETIEAATGATVYLVGDSCYGACDVALIQARELDVDLLIHYGHSSIVEPDILPVLYIHASIDIDVDMLVDAVTPSLKEYKVIGIATTIQHIHQLEEISKALEKKGIIVHIGEGAGKTPYNGQILGCSYVTSMAIADMIEAFLYIGGGKFHPNGIVLSTGKPVIVANPYNGNVSRINEKDLMNLAKRRMAAIAIASQASIVGVIASSKPGQSNLVKAEEIVKLFKEQGKKAVLIYVDELRAEHINNFSEPEILVNTACPRIAVDGIDGVDRPLLTIQEAEVVLGRLRWEDLWGNGYFDRWV